MMGYELCSHQKSHSESGTLLTVKCAAVGCLELGNGTCEGFKGHSSHFPSAICVCRF